MYIYIFLEDVLPLYGDNVWCPLIGLLDSLRTCLQLILSPPCIFY